MHLCLRFVLGATLLLVIPVVAAAAGGSSIAAAPTVEPGVQAFGNTASDQTRVSSCNNRAWLTEFWNLHLIAGDQVLLKGDATAPAWGFHAWVFPAGTTDATVDQRWGQTISPGGRGGFDGAPLVFTANVTGTYPVEFGGECGVSAASGPFNFLVTVYHKALVFLPPFSRISSGGKFTAVVRTPDGSPISDPSLILRLYGVWKDASFVPASRHLIGTAAAVRGLAQFTVRVPARLRGSTIQLRVTGHGNGWQPVANSSATAVIAKGATEPVGRD